MPTPLAMSVSGPSSSWNLKRVMAHDAHTQPTQVAAYAHTRTLARQRSTARATTRPLQARELSLIQADADATTNPGVSQMMSDFLSHSNFTASMLFVVAVIPEDVLKARSTAGTLCDGSRRASSEHRAVGAHAPGRHATKERHKRTGKKKRGFFATMCVRACRQEREATTTYVRIHRNHHAIVPHITDGRLVEDTAQVAHGGALAYASAAKQDSDVAPGKRVRVAGVPLEEVTEAVEVDGAKNLLHRHGIEDEFLPAELVGVQPVQK